MATSGKCKHPPLHPDIINQGCGWFIFLKSTIYIIDIKKFIRICTRCGTRFNIYLYGHWPNYHASFDGKTDLPIITVVENIEFVLLPPLHGNNYGYAKTIDRCKYIIYFPTGTLKRRQRYEVETYTLNDKYILCCIDFENRIIIINTDGEIIKAAVVYSKAANKNRFEIGGGYLEYVEGSEPLIWSYTSAAALKTKPVASVAE